MALLHQHCWPLSVGIMALSWDCCNSSCSQPPNSSALAYCHTLHWLMPSLSLSFSLSLYCCIIVHVVRFCWSARQLGLSNLRILFMPYIKRLIVCMQVKVWLTLRWNLITFWCVKTSARTNLITWMQAQIYKHRSNRLNLKAWVRSASLKMQDKSASTKSFFLPFTHLPEYSVDAQFNSSGSATKL